MGQYIDVNKTILWLRTRRAEAYLNELNDCDTDEEKTQINDEMFYSTRSFIDVLKHQPTVDVAPVVHGHWLKATGMMPPEFFGRHICSECGLFAPNKYLGTHELLSPVCPYCGAHMDEKDGEQNAED